MIKKFNEERGIAMVTALLVSLVVLFLSIVVVALSLHNSTISSFDRKRIQAVDAAEAGIDAWFSGLVTSTGGALLVTAHILNRRAANHTHPHEH